MTRTLTRSLRSATLGAFAAGIFGAALVFVIFGDLAQKPFFYGWLLACGHAYGAAFVHWRAVGQPLDVFMSRALLGNTARAALFAGVFVGMYRAFPESEKAPFMVVAWCGYFTATMIELVNLRQHHGE